MNKILNTCLVLIWFSLVSIAQEQDGYLDSMKAEAKKVTDNRILSDIHRKMAYRYQQYDIEESIKYLEKAVAYALKGNHNEELCRAYILQSTVYETGGYFEEALTAGRKAYELSEILGNKRHRYYAESRIGNAFRRMARFDSALVYNMAALKTAEAYINDSFVSAAALNVGGIYAAIDDFTKAEEYMLQSLTMCLKYGDSLDAAYTYNNLGILNRDLKNYEKAMDYYRKSQALFNKFGDPSSTAFIVNDIGYLFSLTGKLDSAEQYLLAAIAVREKRNERNELVYSYYFLGENYERKGNIKLAEKFIIKALNLAIELKNNKQTYEALESVSDFYARNHMYDSAYAYLQKYKHFRDSLRTIENEQLIEELHTKYETEKKEKKIQQQDFELTRKNYLLAGSAALLLSISLLGYSGYRRYKLKQTARLQAAILKQQELATTAVIEAEENERKRIAGDLHDGVGQMMSAAKINLSSLGNEIQFADEQKKQRFENALKLVDDSCAEVRTVSHNIMPNSLLRNSLAAAVRDFVNKIDRQLIKINLHSEGLNEKIDANTEIMLYRIVQECVNNVIKHSGADTLDITLINEGHEITVTIEDNGRGFDTSDKTKFEGIGLKNIKTRVDYLKGIVEWDSAPGRGTVVSINVPV